MATAAFLERQAQLSNWPKGALIERCALLGHRGVSTGPYGLGKWSPEELTAAILRSEFPAEASNG